jgi:1,4-alpha-glucan branching enzyme
MPGDEWQRFANLRVMFSYMFTHPGTKLVFMGGEFGQTSEWNFEQSLDWHLLDFAPHKGMKECMKALNHLYKTEIALSEYSFSIDGFEWIDTQDRENSVLVYARKSADPDQNLVIVLNLTPTPRSDYRVGVLSGGMWEEIFNSDDTLFYGSGQLNAQPVKAENNLWHGKANSVRLNLPPLAAIILKKTTKV